MATCLLRHPDLTRCPPSWLIETIHVAAMAVILGGSLTLAIAGSTFAGQMWLPDRDRLS